MSKTAEEMFKSLGYECRHIKQCIYYTKVDSFGIRGMTIVFNLCKKTYYCSCGMGIRIPNEEEDEAIQKQCKELNWKRKKVKIYES